MKATTILAGLLAATTQDLGALLPATAANSAKRSSILQDSHIDWMQSLADARALARREGKPMWVVFR